MFADELRRAAEAAPRERLDQVLSALWQACAAGGVDEAEAGAIEALVHARRRARAPLPAQPRRRAVPRRRPPEDIERRRRLVAAGWLPPAIAARFTPGETAALAVIAREIALKGRCTLCHKQIADLAGIGRTTARDALRQARLLGLVRVEQRRVAADRNDSNVVSLCDPSWEAWLRFRRKRAAGGGVGNPTPLDTKELKGRKPWPGPTPAGLPAGWRDTDPRERAGTRTGKGGGEPQGARVP